MKKSLLVVLCICLIVGLVACSSAPATSEDGGASSATDSLAGGQDTSSSADIQDDEDPTDPVATTEPTTAPSVQVTVKKVDLDALKAIEEADDFVLKIASIKTVEGLFDNDAIVDLDGEDGIQIDLQNGTDATVEEFTILLLCTDRNGSVCSLSALGGMPSYIISGGTVAAYNDEVKTLGTTSADLAAGGTKTYSVRCDLEEIKNVNAIVYSYVDKDGNEIINDNFVDWLNNTVEVTAYGA